MDIYQAYLRILLTKEGIKLGQKQIKMLNEQIEIVKAQISANVLTDLDLLNIKTQLSLDELNILNAQNDLNLAFANLKQLLFLPNSTQIDVKDIDLKFMENYGQESVQSIFSRILRRNPDVKMTSLKEEIIEQNIEQIKYLKYPTIGLSIGLNSIY
jgi:outer membrane protein